MPAQLYVTITGGPASGRAFSLAPGSATVVGRDSGCAIAIDDALLSRRHLELRWDGTHAELRDLDSTNGTLLNDALAGRAPLCAGDRIRAGDTVLEIAIVDTPVVAPAAVAAPPAAPGMGTAAPGTASPAPAADPGADVEPVALRVVGGPRKGTVVTLVADQAVVVGRGFESVLVIADDALSARHFEIRWDRRTCVVHDLASGNGTFVNGERVRERAVGTADRIEAGLSTFRVDLPATTATRRRHAPAADAPPAAAATTDAAVGETDQNDDGAVQLRVLQGRRAGETLRVKSDQPCVVGRSHDCTIALDDGRMSERHFEIAWDGTAFVCRDLGSSNGTRINGNRITGATPLADRDEIGAGAALFLVRLPERPAAAAAPAPEDVGRDARALVCRLLSGPRTGELLIAAPSDRIAIGRDAACQIHLDDPQASARHCELRWADAAWRVVDLDSANGTFQNRRRVTDAPLNDRDELRVGQTRLLVRLPAESPPTVPEQIFPLPMLDSFERLDPAPPPPPPAAGSPLAALLAALPPGQVPHLYALIDGAQAIDLAVWARRLGHDVYSLFSGSAAPALAHVGPCLAPLAVDSPFLHKWADALGRSAGVLLQTAADLDALSAHLRQIFVVTDEEGQEYFFRYYDPRVLRVFLPTCTRDELTEFFGPIARWLVETPGGDGFVALSSFGGRLVSAELTSA